ncbi:MAG: hypothetical protein AAGA18_01040 [Verrucomicrobiota bacterium]
MIRKIIAVSSLMLFFLPLFSWAAIKFELTEDARLKIISKNADEFRFVSQGSISERVSLEGQVFRISYGLDIQNRIKIILYSDTNSPQAFDLSLLEKKISLSADAVLTITLDTVRHTVIFKPGVIGTVKIDGEVLANKPLQVDYKSENRSQTKEVREQELVRKTTRTTPGETKQGIQTMPHSTQPSATDIPTATLATNQITQPPRLSVLKTQEIDQLQMGTTRPSHSGLDIIQGPEWSMLKPQKSPLPQLDISSLIQNRHPDSPPTMAIVHGEVSIAPEGSSKFLPISEGQKLPTGATLKTGSSGVAYLVFSNFTGIRVSQNSELIVKESGVDSVIKAMDLLLFLKTGSIVASHQPPTPSATSLKFVMRDLLASGNQGIFSIFRNQDDVEISLLKGTMNVTNGIDTQTILGNQWSQSSPEILNRPNPLPSESQGQLIGLLQVLESTIKYSSGS